VRGFLADAYNTALYMTESSAMLCNVSFSNCSNRLRRYRCQKLIMSDLSGVPFHFQKNFLC
jgi:hypothetical protein